MERERAIVRMATLLAGMLVFTTGCADPSAKAELEKTQAQTALQEQNKALVRQLIDGLNKQDTAVYELYAKDAVLHIPSAVVKPVTPAEDLIASKANWKGFPDLRFTIEDMVAEGDKVAARLHVTGTQKGTWNGISSTGKKIDIGSVMIVRIENGKIVEQREDADFLGLIMQLGMDLRPGKGT
jgi:predicted ester cyclase